MSTSNLLFKNIKFTLDSSITSAIQSDEEKRRSFFIKSTINKNSSSGDSGSGSGENKGSGGDKGSGGGGGGGDKGSDEELHIPPGAAGNVAAMKAAGDAVFGVNGGKTSRCSQYTYHIAYYYTKALSGTKPTGNFIGGHGNAGDTDYRNNLVKLGYKLTSLGTLTKKNLISTIEKINTIGTIINYRAPKPPSPNEKSCSPDHCCEGCCAKANFTYCFGHTQIYTGAVLTKGGNGGGGSNKTNWASSWADNYKCNFVYGRYNIDAWEAYLLTL